VKTTTPIPAPDAETRRMQDALYELAILAEAKGRLDVALQVQKAADAVAPFVPYTDEEIEAMARAGNRNARRLLRGAGAR
jgi:hypothetical protein